MFPRSFAAVLSIVGAIWAAQGLGLIPTGSFMDGQPLWAVIGGVLLVAGLVLMLVQRRRKPADQPDQPEV